MYSLGDYPITEDEQESGCAACGVLSLLLLTLGAVGAALIAVKRV